MIEEATVDAYGESEQVVGFFTVLEDRFLYFFPLPRGGSFRGRGDVSTPSDNVDPTLFVSMVNT